MSDSAVVTPAVIEEVPDLAPGQGLEEKFRAAENLLLDASVLIEDVRNLVLGATNYKGRGTSLLDPAPARGPEPPRSRQG